MIGYFQDAYLTSGAEAGRGESSSMIGYFQDGISHPAAKPQREEPNVFLG